MTVRFPSRRFTVAGSRVAAAPACGVSAGHPEPTCAGCLTGLPLWPAGLCARCVHQVDDTDPAVFVCTVADLRFVRVHNGYLASASGVTYFVTIDAAAPPARRWVLEVRPSSDGVHRHEEATLVRVRARSRIRAILIAAAFDGVQAEPGAWVVGAYGLMRSASRLCEFDVDVERLPVAAAATA